MQPFDFTKFSRSHSTFSALVGGKGGGSGGLFMVMKLACTVTFFSDILVILDSIHPFKISMIKIFVSQFSINFGMICSSKSQSLFVSIAGNVNLYSAPSMPLISSLDSCTGKGKDKVLLCGGEGGYFDQILLANLKVVWNFLLHQITFLG